MHHGVALFPTDYSMHPIELGPALEERGFESVWVAEHSHIPVERRTPWPGGDELPRMYYEAMDPFVALSMIAAVTSSLKVATGICLVPQRDVIQTAKAVASLDRLSAGRFLFGVGAGWNIEEMQNHATDPASRFRLMGEKVEAMRVIWSQAEAQYHGDLVDFDPLMAWPKPVQQPGPPVHVGGAAPQGLRRAVRYGDGWMPIFGRGGDPTEHLSGLTAALAQAGRDRSRFEVSVYSAPNEPDTIARLADAGVDRVIYGLPSADRATLLPLLDALSPY